MSRERLIPVGPHVLVEVWLLEPYGRRMADIYLLDEQAHENYYERRYIEGRLYGRVGSRRYTPATQSLVAQGERALAISTLRQAGIEPKRVVSGRGWL